MHGSSDINTASLSVYSVVSGGEPALLWSAHGRHADAWLQAKIDIQHTTFTQVLRQFRHDWG